MIKTCGRRLAPGQWWSFCGETDMGQTLPAQCIECDPVHGLMLEGEIGAAPFTSEIPEMTQYGENDVMPLQEYSQSRGQREVSKMKKLPWYGLWIADWALVAAGFYIVSVSWWLLPLGLMVIGVGQHALTLLAHDAAHGHAGNEAAARISFLPFIVGLDSYRAFHFAHHRHIGKALDSEIEVKQGWGDYTRRPDMRVRFIKDLFTGIKCVPWLLWRIWSHRPTPADFWGVAVFWSAAIAIAVSAGGWWVLGVWVLSIFTTFWAVFNHRVYFEHVGPLPDGGLTLKHRPPLWRKLLFFPHGTWRHDVHHADVSIPCWKLAR